MMRRITEEGVIEGRVLSNHEAIDFTMKIQRRYCYDGGNGI